MPSKKTKTIAQLKRQLDMRHSRFVRIRDADKEGYIKCITCKKKVHWKKSHACHFVGRANYKHRRDDKNVNAGCVYCNTYNQGRHNQQYTLIMIDRFGRKRVEDAIASNKKINEIKRYQIEELIEKYKSLVMQSQLYNR